MELASLGGEKDVEQNLQEGQVALENEREKRKHQLQHQKQDLHLKQQRQYQKNATEGSRSGKTTKNC